MTLVTSRSLIAHGRTTYVTLERDELVSAIAVDVVQGWDPVDGVVNDLVAGGGPRVDGVLVGEVGLEVGAANYRVYVVRGIAAEVDNRVTALGRERAAVDGESITDILGGDR